MLPVICWSNFVHILTVQEMKWILGSSLEAALGADLLQNCPSLFLRCRDVQRDSQCKYGRKPALRQCMVKPSTVLTKDFLAQGKKKEKMYAWLFTYCIFSLKPLKHTHKKTQPNNNNNKKNWITNIKKVFQLLIIIMWKLKSCFW